MEPLVSHGWPADGEHMWGPWMQKTRSDKPGGATDYRQCIHPDCGAWEERQSPKA